MDLPPSKCGLSGLIRRDDVAVIRFATLDRIGDGILEALVICDGRGRGYAVDAAHLEQFGVTLPKVPDFTAVLRPVVKQVTDDEGKSPRDDAGNVKSIHF